MNINWSLIPVQAEPKFVGIWDGPKKNLLNTLEWAKTKECAAAFRAAGVVTPSEQIEGGLTFVAEELVRNPADDPQWSPDKDMAVGMRIPGSDQIKFAVHGPNLYGLIRQAYGLAALSLALYIVGKSMLNRGLLKLVYLGGIFLAAYQFFQLLRYKYEVLEGESVVTYPYYDWLVKSVQFDWFCISLIALLLLAEISFLVYEYYGKAEPS